MRIKPVKLFFICLLVQNCPIVQAEERPLRILTWNLENLNSAEGVALYPGRSYARTTRDFEAIKKYILASDADILLLQEVGSPHALANVLPEKYTSFFSPQFGKSRPGQSGLFTVVAYDAQQITPVDFKSVATNVEGGEGLASASDTPNLRDTIGIKFSYKETNLWVFSLHLKSSCYQKSLPQKKSAPKLMRNFIEAASYNFERCDRDKG